MSDLAVNMSDVAVDAPDAVTVPDVAVKGEALGRVVSLNGSRVIGMLTSSQAAAGDAPHLQIGSLIKLKGNNTHVFGIINGMSVPMPSAAPEEQMKIVELELIGEVDLPANGEAMSFHRGVSHTPSLDDEFFAADAHDARIIYTRDDAGAIEIGQLHHESAVPVHVSVDALLGRHFAILGSTGTGKSCAVSMILHGILEKHPHAHIVLMDPHGEYAHAFREQAECIEPADLQIPYWLFSFEELVEIVFGSEARDMVAEVAILREFVQQAKVIFVADTDDTLSVTVDTPVPYKMGDLARMIDDALGRLETRSDLAPYQRIKIRLAALQTDRRYAFMFPSSVLVRDNMAAFLSRIFRIPVNGKPISILNLSGVPSEMLVVVVSVLCRMTFDLAMWSDQDTPILLVCEEAHRYTSNSEEEGFEPTRRALARIAKEGRKYGVSLGIISQRPSVLTESVLSQCNTIFALRMTNQDDQDFVRASMSDAGGGLLDTLPSLANAEAIVVGEAISVPMRMRIKDLPLEQRPKSATADFAASWSAEGDVENTLQTIVARWRHQRR